MEKARIKAIAARASEVAIILVLVLGAFGGVVAIVNTLFPAGQGLVYSMNAMKADGARAKISNSFSRRMLVSAGDQETNLLDKAGITAVLRETVHTVKRKPADGIAWARATDETPLYDHDAVQTVAGASAKIVFDKDNQLVLGSNSLIIVARMEQDVFRNRRRSVMVMMDGELKGTLKPAKDMGLSVEVNTPGAITRISGDERSGKPADFKITVNSDKSSTVTVFSGVAEVGAEGKSVMVKANQFVTVEEGKAPVRPANLPTAVVALLPRHNHAYVYRDLPPRVEFNWTRLKGANSYHLTVARDPEFQRVLVDEQLAEPAFRHGNLREGDYYWRVSARSGEGEGAFSESRHLRIVRDADPPVLDVLFPVTVVDADSVTLSGSTEPGAAVYVDSAPAQVDSRGGFSQKLRLEPGVNVVVVEAVDEAGNIAYQSGTIYGRSRAEAGQ